MVSVYTVVNPVTSIDLKNQKSSQKAYGHSLLLPISRSHLILNEYSKPLMRLTYATVKNQMVFVIVMK